MLPRLDKYLLMLKPPTENLNSKDSSIKQQEATGGVDSQHASSENCGTLSTEYPEKASVYIVS